MSLDLAPRLSLAARLAKEAGAHIMTIYQTDFTVAYKTPSDPVTQADQEANALIVKGLHDAFPDDGIVAEESPTPIARLTARYIWYVDPLDGTKEFIGKNGEFSVMIGLAIDGRAALGVVYRPDQDLLYRGIVGQDARLDQGPDSRVLSASAKTRTDDLTLIVSRSHRNPRIDAIKQQLGIGQELPCGSVGLKIGRIATQDADLYLEPGPYTSVWDACAPEAIIKAAGGQFTDIFGRPILYSSESLKNTDGLLATNGPSHDAVVSALADILPQLRS